jgi:hypothetical protein
VILYRIHQLADAVISAFVNDIVFNGLAADPELQFQRSGIGTETIAVGPRARFRLLQGMANADSEISEWARGLCAERPNGPRRSMTGAIVAVDGGRTAI